MTTFTRDYDEVIQYVPIDRILTETDAPYVTPVPHRGKRNEPSYIPHIVERLAELRGVEKDKMAGHAVTNAKRVFNI